MRHGLILTLTLALIGLSTTPSFGQEAKKEEVVRAIKEFEKFFANQNKHLRKAAVEGIGDCNSEKVIPFILSALKDKEEIVRSAVQPALEKQNTPKALALLTRSLKNTKKMEAKIIILESFKKTRPKVAYKSVLKMAEGKVFELRLLAAELLGVLPAKGSASSDALLKLLDAKEPQIRLVAIDSLIALKFKGALDRCILLMQEDKDWRVQATAIAACVPFRDKRSIEPLMDILETGEGRLRDDAHHALVKLTGKQYSSKPSRWRSWWKRAKNRFEVPTEAEIKKKEKELEEAMAAYGNGGGESPPFLGIKTKSKRILFILDISGSMVDLVIPYGTSEEKSKKFRELYGEGNTKIDLCRNQLINTIAGLKKHVKFNILLFDSDIHPWKKKLVKASAGNRNLALKFLGDLTPEKISRRVAKVDKGGTNTFAALNWAFGLKKSPQQKPSKNHKVEGDTVFFLTDGLPSVGRMKDVNELLRYFMVVNRRAKIVFHTMTFGTGNNGFLEPMAKLSGGRFVSVVLN